LIALRLMAMIWLLILTAPYIQPVMAAQSAPLTDEQVDALNREEARKRRVIAESDDRDPWEIAAFASDWARRGAYPDFVPDAGRAVAWLEQRLANYRGPDRVHLEKNLAGLRQFADELNSDLQGAAAGDAEALYEMGRRYNDSSSGVVRDRETAMRYFAAAAAKGHAQANYNMAQFLKDEPGGRPKAIAYMQEAHRLGFKSAAGWLRDWGAPLSPQHAATTAAQARSNAVAATAFAPGAFQPTFWGDAPADAVRRTLISTDELRPLLEQVKAGTIGMPASSGFRAWGLGLGTSPTRAQLLASARTFDSCVLRPVTSSNVMGMDLSQTARVRFEEWSAGNRRAVYVQCATGNAFFEGGASNWIIYYLIDGKLVAVQATVSIYAGPAETRGDRILCVPPTRAPSQLVASVQRDSSGWKTIRAVELSKTPLSGVRLGHWYTLTRPGAFMHIFTRNWTSTIEGTSTVARCGSGYSEYLIVTPEMNNALQLDGSRLPELRIGRPASL